jgi:hypothetical protein
MAMNGDTPKIEILDPAKLECIQLLEQVLADAKAGNVVAVAIVACGASGFGAAFAGNDAPKLNLGLDSAKATLLQMVSGGQQPGTQQPRKPTIVPARFR